MTPTEIAIQIGARIRTRLEVLDLTHQQLADAIGVARQHVTLWISGKWAPSADKLVSLADALDCTTDYLLGRSER